MKILQRYKVTSINGNVEKEKLGETKSIVDSIADNLVIDGEISIERLSKSGLNIITVWEEVKAPKKVIREKKTETKNQ